MKKFSQLFLMVFGLLGTVFGQGWEREFNDPMITTEADYFPAPDGGIFLTSFKNPPVFDLFYYHLNQNGEIDGQQEVLHDFNSQVFSGNEKGEAIINLNSSNHQLVKINADGDSMWAIVDYPLGLCIDPMGLAWKKDGGIFLFYGTFDTNWNVVCHSVDGDGNTVFAKELENNGWNGELNSIAETPDGGCVLGYSSQAYNQSKIVKLKANGDFDWERMSEVSYNISSVLATPAAIYTCKNVSNNIIEKISLTGDSIWTFDSKHYDGTAFFSALAEAKDGQLIAAGSYYNPLIINQTSGILIKIDKNSGDLIWKKYFDHPIGANRKIIQPKTGGFMFGGYNFNSFSLYSTDENGNTLTNEISGTIFPDWNKDCAPQPGEKGRGGITVTAEKGQKTISTTTDSLGKFALRVEPGDYKVGFSPPFYFEDCTYPTQVSLMPYDTVRYEIGLKPTVLCPFLEISMASPVFRRCFEDNYFVVQYKNAGTADAIGAMVEVELDSSLSIISSTLPIAGQSGQVFKFNLGTVKVDETGSFRIVFKVDCQTTFGQMLCNSAHIFPDSLCLPTGQNRVAAANQFCLPVTGSFDPNDKQAFAHGYPVGSMLPDSSLEYLIRFQNTGNDTAFLVVIRDTLDARLDPMSVVPGAASHPYSFEILEGNILKFTFRNILLPDSNVNEVASHGFIKFFVDQRKGNAIDQFIANRAAIYFDFNEPVLTNWAKVYLDPELVSIKVPAPGGLKIWPNPTTESVQVDLPDNHYLPVFWKITDLNGREMQAGQSGSAHFSIKSNGLASGLYFLSVSDDRGVPYVSKIVFQ